MTTVLLIIQLMISIVLIGLILIQRSEGGALGIGGRRYQGNTHSRHSVFNQLPATHRVFLYREQRYGPYSC